MVDCGVTCAKYSVFLFNLLFAVSSCKLYLHMCTDTKYQFWFLYWQFDYVQQLTGIAILTVGAVIFTAYHHYQNFLGKPQIPFDQFQKISTFECPNTGDEIWSAPTVFMIIGGIVFLIAFLGCCGAIKESSCMVLTVSESLAGSLLPIGSIYNTLKPFNISVLASVGRYHNGRNWNRSLRLR